MRSANTLTTSGESSSNLSRIPTSEKVSTGRQLARMNQSSMHHSSGRQLQDISITKTRSFQSIHGDDSHSTMASRTLNLAAVLLAAESDTSSFPAWCLPWIQVVVMGRSLSCHVGDSDIWLFETLVPDAHGIVHGTCEPGFCWSCPHEQALVALVQ